MLAQKDMQGLNQLLDINGIKRKTTLLLQEQLQQARNALSNLNNLGLKITLHGFIGKIFGKYL